MLLNTPSRPARNLELLSEDDDVVGGLAWGGLGSTDADVARSGLASAEVSFFGLASKPPASGRSHGARFRDAESGLLATLYREVVIRVRPGTPDNILTALLRRHGMAIKRRSAFVDDQLVVSDPTYGRAGVELIEISNDLNDTDEIEFATPNFVSEYTRAVVPIHAADQWHLGATRTPQAWEVSTGKGTIVAVLDDGVDLTHRALRRRLWRNPDKAALDVHGRDFFVRDTDAEHWNPSPKVSSPPWTDLKHNDFHGTQCAGLVGAALPPGVAPGSKILPIRIFSAGHMAADEQVADAIRYATKYAHILSCSWYGPHSTDVEYALRDAANGRGKLGVPAFFAAGNESGAPIRYPARDPNAIAVGAVTNRNERASYSNVGPELSIVAPGGDTLVGLTTTDLSALGRGSNPGLPPGDSKGEFTSSFVGTSAATPIAAGVAALMIAANPSMERGAIRELLQSSATKVGNVSYVNGRNDEYGHGLIDAAAAVTQARAARPKKKPKA